ncbi:RDD family protein [Streptomyces sp. NPDC048664]|uniref:RDD family protein n=1 Tax=Streptomyces sp. NPDC048664 TaxID=3154505 RepID=UPI0034212ECE
MSAPTPASGDDRPREGYYPDPSIPGYVRYWNGVAWVPGTSRPAPSDGLPLSPPPGAQPVAHAAAPVPLPQQGAPAARPAVEETGPHFFDEDPAEGPAAPGPAASQHGSRPEPASAWGADRSRQTGFGREQDRVSWGAAGDPRSALAGRPDGTVTRMDGTAMIPPAEPEAATDSGASPGPEGTVVFRRQAREEAPGARDAAEGTMAFRALTPRAGERSGGAAAPGPAQGQRDPSAQTAAARQALGLDPQLPKPQLPNPNPSPAPQRSAPQHSAQPRQAKQPQQPQPQQAAVPQQSASPAAAPLTAGPGGGQPSWAQQVHRLADPEAQGEGPVAPWKPPVDDPFQAAARAQAAVRPAGLGKRLAARLLDTLVLAAVTGVAAVPLGTKAIDHINDKIDAAKLSGQTVTVWLLDGTTSVYLGVVLAVLLGFGVLYEVLPTARWGRTLGKRLCGIEVRDIEAHEPPSFGPALRRWLVYSVPGLVAVGVVGVLWCLFDRPWHQCWHDKAAHTFVAG